MLNTFFFYYYVLKSYQRKCQCLYMKFVHAKTKVESNTYRGIHLLLGAVGRMGLVIIIARTKGRRNVNTFDPVRKTNS